MAVRRGETVVAWWLMQDTAPTLTRQWADDFGDLLHQALQERPAFAAAVAATLELERRRLAGEEVEFDDGLSTGEMRDAD